MKVAVIGTGSSSIQSVCQLLHYVPECSVTLIHSPDTFQLLDTAESTDSTFLECIQFGLDFSIVDDLKELGTMNHANHYVNWRDTSFDGPLLKGNTGLNINVRNFIDFSIPRLKSIWEDRFTEIVGVASKISDIGVAVLVDIDEDVYDFDYVIDCGGIPDSLDDYWKFDDDTVNHCLVHTVDTEEGAEWGRTHTVATQDGWMYRIPLTNKISNGYMFNHNITTIEEARNNFCKELNISIEELQDNDYEFSNYYTLDVLSGRVLKNGHKAFFFEPMFTSSIWKHYVITDLFCRFLQGRMDDRTLNSEYRMHCNVLKDMFAFKYHGGSLHHTSFWKYVTDLSKQRLNNSFIFANVVGIMQEKSRNKTSYINDIKWCYETSGLKKLDKVFEYNYFKSKEETK
jgi:hypothetical protein